MGWAMGEVMPAIRAGKRYAYIEKVQKGDKGEVDADHRVERDKGRQSKDEQLS